MRGRVRRRSEMRMERQGHKECMLAVIAALQGRLLAVVRQEALNIAQTASWSTEVENPLSYWNAVEAVAGPRLYAVLRPLHRRPPPAGLPETIPSTGRGVVTVIWASGGGHIMGWQNGLIYDPQSTNPEIPVTLDEWLLLHPRARVHAICTIDGGQ